MATLLLTTLALAVGAVPAAAAPEIQLQVRDFAAGPGFVPLSLHWTSSGTGALYLADSRELGLALDLEVTPGTDRTLYDCSVRDTRGKDRALTVRCGVPLDAVGWQWWDDLGTSRAVEEGKLYERVQSWHAGGRTLSVYPFCALAGKERGVALAMDLNDPRVYRFRYDAGAQVLWTEVDLGLAEDRSRAPAQAAFAFVQFAFDPAWGFRSALQRYYDLFPEFVKRRAPEDGIWLLGFEPAVMANPWDFGMKFDEGAQTRAAYDVAHGIEPYVYTEPWGRYRGFGKQPTTDGKPRYGEKAPLRSPAELVESVLSDLSFTTDDGCFDERQQRWAAALRNSAITDAEGRWVWRHWTDEWSKDNWLSNLTCNPDPDLPEPNRATMTWEDELWPAFRTAEANGGALKGVYLDSVAGFMGFANESFRREHWRHADTPLVPSEATKGPAQLHAFACVEFARQVALEMWSRGNLVIANTMRPYMQFFCHLTDMIGAGETKTCGLASDEHYRYLRAYAGTKPVSWMDYSFVNPAVSWEQKERGIKRCLHYAVHPGTASFRDRDAFEPSRPLFRHYEPLIIRLGQAGWQPVTGARVTDASSRVLIERYGSGPEGFYLTLRNPAAEVQVGEVSAEVPAAIAKARDRIVWDPIAGVPAKGARIDARAGRLVASFSLAPEETAVLQVSTRSRIVADLLADAVTWLARFQAEARWVGRDSGGILSNGGFEQGIAGWAEDKPAARSSEVSVADEGALAGEHSLRVTSHAADAFAAVSQSTSLRGGVPYMLSFTYRWTRPDGAAGTVVPRFGVKDAAGEWLQKEYLYIRDLQPTEGKAVRFEREITLAAATAGGFFQLLCSGAFGAFEVDDIVLRPATEPTARESAEKALAAVASSGAEARLKEAVAQPGKAAAHASEAVAALVSAIPKVEEAVGNEHLRRCLALPLQAAALAASGAVEASAGVYAAVPLFPVAVAGEATEVVVALHSESGKRMGRWSARLLGKVPVEGDGASVQVRVPLPADCPWGWHDALVAADAGVGRTTLHLLKRVTLRPQAALSLAPAAPVISSLDGVLRMVAANRSSREAPGKLRVEARDADGRMLKSEQALTVAAGDSATVRVPLLPARSAPGTLQATATWSVDDRVLDWKGDLFCVPGAACPMVAKAPAIDARLDDAAWKRAAVLAPLLLAGEPKPAVKQTSVLACRDADALYVAFTCHGPTADLSAGRTERDGELWLDDSVEVFLDPTGKRREYYQLIVNAAGAQYDAQCGPGGLQAGWNADWTARVSKTADAWFVEMAIPFEALHATPTGAWAANFCRHDAATGEASAWACPFGGFHAPSRFGELRME